MSKKFYVKNDDGSYEEVNAIAQQDFDVVIAQRIARKEKDHEEELAKYKGFKEKAENAEKIEAEYKSKLDELQSNFNKSEEEAKKLQTEITRQKILREFNLSEELEEFISGESEEDFRTKAEKLAQKVNNQSGVKIDKDDKPPVQESESHKIARDLLGNKD